MPNAFATITFTESVKAAQTKYGSRERNIGFELSDDPRNTLGFYEKDFIETRDSFYQATISENAWPYVQHRGGPKGFLKVLDERTVGYADFSGNRQYLSVGNLNANNRISLILMDYPGRRRLKIWGTTQIIHESEEPDKLTLLATPAYQARVERGVLIRIEAIEWNCPQHITPRFSELEMESIVEPLLAKIQTLKGKLRATPSRNIERFGEGSLQLVVTAMRQLTNRVRVYEFKQLNGEVLPRFEAGAHIKVPIVLEGSTAQTRCYSLSSNPGNRSIYEIAVKLEPGGTGGSKFIHENYRLGTQLNCEPPSNFFKLDNSGEATILIAGGIGITPIKAMAHELKNHRRNFELHFSAKKSSDMPFLDDLRQEFPKQLKIYASLEQRMNLSEIIATAPQNSIFYLCGPSSLIDGFIRVSKELAIPLERVKYEKFHREDSNEDKEFTLELKRSNLTINIGKGQSILDAISDAGIQIDSDCRAGMCGRCAVQVLEGKVQHKDNVLSENDRNEKKLMCTCVSRSDTEKLVLDI